MLRTVRNLQKFVELIVYSTVGFGKRAKRVVSQLMTRNGCEILQMHLDPVLSHSNMCLPQAWPAGSRTVGETFRTIIVECSLQIFSTVLGGITTYFGRILMRWHMQFQKSDPTFGNGHSSILNLLAEQTCVNTFIL